MKIIRTHEDRPDKVTQTERDWVYNGLDCCVTAEVLEALLPQLDNHTAATYSFSKDLQAPVLEMRCRGILVDEERKARVLDEFFDSLDFLERNLERIVLEGCGLDHFNWRSNADLKTLFYDTLRIPPIKRGGTVTVNRDALEKMQNYLVAKPIVAHMMAMRDIGKKISVLKTAIDPDGRMRTSYNIAGTNGFRFSSSFSEFGTGGNLQNIEESLREIFISDPGHKFAKFDGAQIQSRIVGAAEWEHVDNGTYLDVCESGDLHTSVAKMTWPNFPWTGDLKSDKIIAGQLLYRHHSHRDACKVLGHGTNFDGLPPTLSALTRIPVVIIQDFQTKYHAAFPGHRLWKAWVEQELYSTGKYTALGGQRRQFWGRRNDPAVLREALAYEGQATEARIVNSALLRVWRASVNGDLPIMVMTQEHDAIVVQYLEPLEDELIPQILKLLPEPIELKNGRVLVVPYDCKTGWNKGDYNAKTNPSGLKDYQPGDKRKRPEKVSILDRVIR